MACAIAVECTHICNSGCRSLIGSSGEPGSSVMKFQWVRIVAEAAELVKWMVSSFTLVFCGAATIAAMAQGCVAFGTTCYGALTLASWSSRVQLSVDFVVLALVLVDMLATACLDPAMSSSTLYFAGTSAAATAFQLRLYHYLVCSLMQGSAVCLLFVWGNAHYCPIEWGSYLHVITVLSAAFDFGNNAPRGQEGLGRQF
eukprot:1029959-Amphidinium_carterae.1